MRGRLASAQPKQVAEASKAAKRQHGVLFAPAHCEECDAAAVALAFLDLRICLRWILLLPECAPVLNYWH